MSRFLASTSVTAGTLSHEKLRKSPFFAECDASFLTRLIKDLSVELFTTGEMVMEQGEHADKMYYLMMGEVEVLLGQGKVRVAKLQEGTVFGEMAMFNHLGNGFARRSATIRALNFCDTRVINKDRFHAILKQHPKERARFEKIAQERKSKLEKSKAVLRPEGPQLRPAAQNSNAASQAVKLKALLGRRASLPVDWANGGPKTADDLQSTLKDDLLDRPLLQSSNTSGTLAMDLAKTLPTPAALAAAALEANLEDESSTSSSSSESGLEMVEEITLEELTETSRPTSSLSQKCRKMVQCPEGRRPRVASLLTALKEVAAPGRGVRAFSPFRSTPKRRRSSDEPKTAPSPLAEMLRRPRPLVPEAITRSNEWKTAVPKTKEGPPVTQAPSCSALRSRSTRSKLRRFSEGRPSRLH